VCNPTPRNANREKVLQECHDIVTVTRDTRCHSVGVTGDIFAKPDTVTLNCLAGSLQGDIDRVT